MHLERINAFKCNMTKLIIIAAIVCKRCRIQLTILSFYKIKHFTELWKLILHIYLFLRAKSRCSFPHFYTERIRTAWKIYNSTLKCSDIFYLIRILDLLNACAFTLCGASLFFQIYLSFKTSILRKNFLTERNSMKISIFCQTVRLREIRLYTLKMKDWK